MTPSFFASTQKRPVHNPSAATKTRSSWKIILIFCVVLSKYLSASLSSSVATCFRRMHLIDGTHIPNKTSLRGYLVFMLMLFLIVCRPARRVRAYSSVSARGGQGPLGRGEA